jgi:tetratricopeptide (TPR) repeat protein
MISPRLLAICLSVLTWLPALGEAQHQCSASSGQCGAERVNDSALVMLLGAHDAEAAYQGFVRSIGLDSTYARAQLNAALVARASGRWSAVRQHLKAASRAPGALGARARRELLVVSVDSAEAAQPGAVSARKAGALVARALTLAEAGDRAAAFAMLARASLVDTGAWEPHAAAGGILASSRNWPEAARFYQKARDRAPRPLIAPLDEAIRDAGVRAHADAIARTAAASLGVDARAALQQYARATALVPGEPTYRLGMALARVLGGEVSVARDTLVQLRASDNPLVAALARKALDSLVAIGSIPAYRTVADSAYDRGVRLANGGNWPEAVAALQVAVREEPGSARSRRALGLAAAQGGSLDVAQASFLAAVRLEPGDPSAWANLAVVAYRRNRYPLAVRAYVHALQLKPGEGAYTVGLSRALAQMGLQHASERVATDARKLND